MKTVVLRDGRDIVLEERPEPEPGPGEVLFRSQHCGICGTDLHAPLLTDIFVPNVVMGHEFAGEVLAVGPGVGDWKRGDRASISPVGNVCGTCEQCRSGKYNLCHTARKRMVGLHLDGGMEELISEVVEIGMWGRERWRTLRGRKERPQGRKTGGIRHEWRISESRGCDGGREDTGGDGDGGSEEDAGISA